MPVPIVTPTVIAPLVAANLARAEDFEPMDPGPIFRKAAIGTAVVCAILAILIGGGLLAYTLMGG